MIIKGSSQTLGHKDGSKHSPPVGARSGVIVRAFEVSPNRVKYHVWSSTSSVGCRFQPIMFQVSAVLQMCAFGAFKLETSQTVQYTCTTQSTLAAQGEPNTNPRPKAGAVSTSLS